MTTYHAILEEGCAYKILISQHAATFLILNLVSYKFSDIALVLGGRMCKLSDFSAYISQQQLILYFTLLLINSQT